MIPVSAAISSDGYGIPSTELDEESASTPSRTAV